MKVIDLLNKIANGEEVPKKIKTSDDDIFYYDETDDNEVMRYKNQNDIPIIDEFYLNDEVEIIEEDKLKTKIIVVDKEGNEKEYLLELGEGLKEGEKIFKANNGNWYAQKLIDKKSEFYKWLNEFKPTIYYSMEEDKKIEKIEEPKFDKGRYYLKGIDGSMHEISLIERRFRLKINEIIDYLNSEDR